MELEAALTAPQVVVSPKYFYDSMGSRLFEAICLLPEYYPTRTEAEIFASHADDIARVAGTGTTLIDLGAGNCAKAASLFSALQPRQYVPVDISAEFLHGAVAGLRKRFPDIAMQAVAMDFSESMQLPAGVGRERRLFFYPGSSLGNFNPEQALQFLRRLRQALQIGADGGVLLGLDLVKPAPLLNAAYDDAIGVTAAFNLNMLSHVNRLIGTDFDPRDWRHVAFFNEEKQRVEMHLEARRYLNVQWETGQRTFHIGERIHTECSHKYTPQGIETLLAQAGFGDCTMWFDPQRWFAVCHARAC